MFLLEEIRKMDKKNPIYYFMLVQIKKEHVDEALRRGAQGCTNNPGELIDLVLKKSIKKIRTILKIFELHNSFDGEY